MVVCEVSYTENMASDLYFNEESYYSEGIQVTVKTCSTILQPFQFVPEQKKIVVERAMRKKLNILILKLLIYHIFDLFPIISIGADADITKTKGEK